MVILSCSLTLAYVAQALPIAQLFVFAGELIYFLLDTNRRSLTVIHFQVFSFLRVYALCGRNPSIASVVLILGVVNPAAYLVSMQASRPGSILIVVLQAVSVSLQAVHEGPTCMLLSRLPVRLQSR